MTAALFRQVFDRVVDNGRTLAARWCSSFRSGQFGRKSLSYVFAAGRAALAERGVLRGEAAVGLDRPRPQPPATCLAWPGRPRRTTPAGRCSAG